MKKKDPKLPGLIVKLTKVQEERLINESGQNVRELWASLDPVLQVHIVAAQPIPARTCEDPYLGPGAIKELWDILSEEQKEILLQSSPYVPTAFIDEIIEVGSPGDPFCLALAYNIALSPEHLMKLVEIGQSSHDNTGSMNWRISNSIRSDRYMKIQPDHLDEISKLGHEGLRLGLLSNQRTPLESLARLYSGADSVDFYEIALHPSLEGVLLLQMIAFCFEAPENYWDFHGATSDARAHASQVISVLRQSPKYPGEAREMLYTLLLKSRGIQLIDPDNGLPLPLISD